jgi:FlaA1/EpsC-like NDP-sugar epimerase
MWRYTSLVDLFNVVKAITLSTLGIMAFVLLRYRFIGYPRSVFLIDWGLTLFFISGFRLAIRLHFAKTARATLLPFLSGTKRTEKKLVIIGAGNTGEKVAREILDNPRLKLALVGFLDDNPAKQGRTIHGIPIMGGVNDIASFTHLFDEILIAIPLASATQMRTIVSACEQIGKPFHTVPAMSELIDGKISIKKIRNVTLQDLFGREEVQLRSEEILQCLQRKRVMITGAGGSIGSELVRQVSRFYPDRLALVDMGEFNLFQIEQECRRRFPYIDVSGYLTDIRDLKSVFRIFKEFHPHVVFHAAAYKHVPLQEMHPWEAVQNNILGTRNLIEVALDFLTERFVLVSTDKAVRPTSVMGATKRVAEKFVMCANKISESRFMVVRFGNVMGSSGSVIPIFQEQIIQGGPVTVTHPEITRYFMSIPEAAQLILQAGAMAEGGEIFLLDMGQPVRIVDLARELIRLYGYEPDRDIEIQYTGLRPGEKLYEELITEGEGIVKTDHEKILVVRGNHYDLSLLLDQVERLLTTSKTYDAVQIKKTLRNIVPEYTPEF